MDDDTLMTAADHEALVAELAALEPSGRELDGTRVQVVDRTDSRRPRPGSRAPRR